MLDRAMNSIPPQAHIHLADASEITTTASNIGKAILAATVVLALVTAFFSQDQRKWMVVGTILLIGGFTFMIVGDPTGTLTDLGNFMKTNLWDPLLSS